MNKFNQIILASGSPRRLEILREHGINPVLMPASVKENLPEQILPEDAVMYLAFKKAHAAEGDLILSMPDIMPSAQDSTEMMLREELTDDDEDVTEEREGTTAPGVYSGTNSPYLIIGADMVVYDPDLGILGKPKDHDDAFRMLDSLRGKKHRVLTGCALIVAGLPSRRVFYESTDVYCKNYSDADIEKYIDSGEPFDKAGAYGIQGPFGEYIDHIDGSYDNVVGLPFARLEKEIDTLKRFFLLDATENLVAPQRMPNGR